MRGFIPRLGPVVLFLIALGFDLSPYQNETISYVLWGIAVVWGLYVAWPWIKRWRPWTLAPADDDSIRPMPRPSGTRAEGTLTVKYPDLSAEIKRLNEENEQLTAERDALREEKRQNLQEQRRKRIEEWRTTIRNFQFHLYGFAGTDTYSQMKPYLQSEVVEMFEAPRTVHIGNEARGDTTYKYTLLDEVARIEKEWGLI